MFKNLKLCWRRFLRRDWPILKTGRPGARFLAVLLAAVLVFSWGCAGPMTTLGTLSGGAIGYGVGGPAGAAAGAGIGMLGGALADTVVYGPKVFTSGQDARTEEMREYYKTERDRTRAQTVLNAPSVLGCDGDASYTSTVKGEEEKSAIRAKCKSPSLPTFSQGAPYRQTQERIGPLGGAECGWYRDPYFCYLYQHGQAPPRDPPAGWHR